MADIKAIKGTDNVVYNLRDDYSQWGGNNLLRDTKLFAANGVVSTETGYLRSSGGTITANAFNDFTSRTIASSSGGVIGEWLINDCKNGETYTLSFWAKGSGSPRCYFYGPSGYIRCAYVVNSLGGIGTASDGNSDTNIPITVTDTWKRYWVTWTLATSGGTSAQKYALIRNDNKGNYSICGVKLERGMKATDWSPHYKDIFRYDTTNEQLIVNL